MRKNFVKRTVRFIFFLMILLLSLLSCTKEKNNPLDPINTTSTDPFQLRFDMRITGVRLNWEQIDNSNIEFYKIYRRIIYENSFTLIDSVDSNIFSYFDDSIVTNITYLYSITAIDQKGFESEKSKTVQIVPPDEINLFSSPNIIQINGNTSKLSTFNINNDNLVDLVLNNGNIVLLRNEGDGNFFVYNTYKFPDMVVNSKLLSVGDFDFDNDDDIVLNVNSDSLLFLWNRNSEFDSTTCFSVIDSSEQQITSLNCIKNNNIVQSILYTWGWENIGKPLNLYSITNFSNPYFSNSIDSLSTISVIPSIKEAIVVDVTNNKLSEYIVIGEYYPGGMIEIYSRVSNLNIYYYMRNSFYTDERPFTVATGDLDNDNLNDFVVTTHYDHSDALPYGIYVYINNGTTFEMTKYSDFNYFLYNGYFKNPRYNKAIIFDINNDNNNDLIVTSEGSTDIFIWLGNGDGTLQKPIYFGAGITPSSILSEDIDNDGDIDLIFSGYSGISIMLNNNR